MFAAFEIRRLAFAGASVVMAAIVMTGSLAGNAQAQG